MKFLTLEQIRMQCNLDADDTSEDAYLTLVGEAVEAAVSADLNRTLYTDAVPDDDSNGLVVTKNILLGMLLLVGQYYANREATITGTIISEVPLSYRHLINPHRIIPV